jgi:integrase
MPKRNPELNALQVKRLPPGTHFVGGVGGLTLQVGDRAPDAHQSPASWILRVYVAGVRRNIGLGSYPEISLAEARERAKAIKDQAKVGVDPIRQKAAQKAAARQELAKAKTFKDCAEAYMATHANDYKNAKHAKQWVSTIRNDAYPIIGNILVQDLSLDDMLAVLKPIWTEKTETADRLRGRIEKVIDFAISSGYRDGSNPARWRGYLSLQLPLPSRIAPTKHFDSLPYRLMPEFMAALRDRDGSAARALEFLIHTATRSGSVRLATWKEIDLEERLWNIPAAHTKTDKPHRVPLSDAALDVLKRQPRTLGSNLLFPSERGSKALSDMAMNSVIRRMREDGDLTVAAVPHGFRSTFKVWATEQTDYPSEMTEICLMHSVGDAVYEAYQRSDMFEKRRHVMNDWSNYVLSSKPTSRVTQISHPRRIGE